MTAKQIDPSKIERIREASYQVITESGIKQASVAAIAQLAGVSVGYLYRHYPSKDDLIDDLLDDAINIINDKFEELNQQFSSVQKVVREIIGFILESATVNPYKLKFLIMLLNDFSYEVKPAIRERMKQLVENLIERGKTDRSLRVDLTSEDFYVAAIGLPLQYLAVDYKFHFTDPASSIDPLILKVQDISINIVK